MKAEYGMSVQISENVWRKASITLDGAAGETPEQLLTRAQSVVEKWFQSPDPHADKFNSTQTPLPEIKVEGKKPNIYDEMMSCEEVTVLESYKLIVKGNPELQAAYDKKLAELKK